MNALTLHLNNAFLLCKKENAAPRRELPQSAYRQGLLGLNTFRGNLRVSLVTALNAPQNCWNDENICEMACLIADEDNRR